MKYTFVVEKKCTIRYRNMISVYIYYVYYIKLGVYICMCGSVYT